MARIAEPTARALKAWNKWVQSRPPVVRAIAERFDPWTLYLLKTTGQRVTIVSFFEDGTVKVDVSGEYNATLFERQVFGINPDDLEPCELPDPEEITGTIMTGEEVDANIDAMRVAIRPDLFVMGDDGTAIRKS